MSKTDEGTVTLVEHFDHHVHDHLTVHGDGELGVYIRGRIARNPEQKIDVGDFIRSLYSQLYPSFRDDWCSLSSDGIQYEVAIQASHQYVIASVDSNYFADHILEVLKSCSDEEWNQIIET